jgi:transposase-like protein
LLLTDPDATVTAVAEQYGVSPTTLYKELGEFAAKEAAA